MNASAVQTLVTPLTTRQGVDLGGPRNKASESVPISEISPRLAFAFIVRRLVARIFGYINYHLSVPRKVVVDRLINGLKRLEYRGYDSAGLSVDEPQGVASGTKPELFRTKGNVSELEKLTATVTEPSLEVINHIGIAHTRWATHGEPCERNSHPQSSDSNNEFVVVHNGIITNFAPLKQMLIGRGFVFESDTDTEVIVKLAKFLHDKQPTTDFRTLMVEVAHLLDGAFAIIIKSSRFPGEAVAVKRGSPLILGIKGVEGNVMHIIPSKQAVTQVTLSEDDTKTPVEYFLASDGMAIVEHTQDVVYLEDNELLHFDKQGRFEMYSLDNPVEAGLPRQIFREFKKLEVELSQIEKGDYDHYMYKEIYEQAFTVNEVMRGRLDHAGIPGVKLGGVQNRISDIKRSNRIIMIACGTSYHSAVATRGIFEELAELPVSVELASDFMDREPPIFRNDTVIFISQSGETADSLIALAYCRKFRALCLGVTNTVGSAIARNTDCGIHLNCGPEIGVASTKAYTSQIIALILLALTLGEDSISTKNRREEIMMGLRQMSDLVKSTLALDGKIKSIAERLHKNSSLLVMGRGYQYATCLEAALKIKEICYIHCEGVMSGELKHGPLALIDDALPIVFIATRDKFFSKISDGLQQVRARKGQPIVVCTEGESDEFIPKEFIKIEVPPVVDCLQAVINIIPMQLLSYHMAVLRGCNVDKPRNLAKSVTVTEK
ncbi:glucosamine-fructose-6-phosphate aminotransferase 2 [Planoprotostelium fungivorum]|uniref:glutamine--fructose-6-phosphate transaminase (isomerizing) n=1 Tax=Planoprotostelium fungivorum TaxID=1890364 RepID=A0A2P6N5Y3_9EUKA|nr:glucosamine-fructose-6-phosphate aminotransferase 2 [Planoprotostelium fungivorum]